LRKKPSLCVSSSHTGSVYRSVCIVLHSWRRGFFNVWLLALGLVAGKGASFISARTSYPLSQWSPNAPFYVSAAATGFSFTINLVYISISKWLIREAGAEFEDSELRTEAKRRSVVSMTEAQVIQQVADRRRFKMKEVFKLGDVVWACVRIAFLRSNQNCDHFQ